MISCFFDLILRKVRSFWGSISLTVLFAFMVSWWRRPAYWTVVELSRVVLIGMPEKWRRFLYFWLQRQIRSRQHKDFLKKHTHTLGTIPSFPHMEGTHTGIPLTSPTPLIFSRDFQGAFKWPETSLATFDNTRVSCTLQHLLLCKSLGHRLLLQAQVLL